MNTVEQNLTIEAYDSGALLRALLILIKSDKGVWEHEMEIFIREGIKLGYEKDFCESAVNEILQNKYIDDTPPVLHRKVYARKFLHIGVQLLNLDVELHPEKVLFLERFAKANNLEKFLETSKYKRLRPK